jgi:hypothetical protein
MMDASPLLPEITVLAEIVFVLLMMDPPAGYVHHPLR